MRFRTILFTITFALCNIAITLSADELKYYAKLKKGSEEYSTIPSPSQKLLKEALGRRSRCEGGIIFQGGQWRCATIKECTELGRPTICAGRVRSMAIRAGRDIFEYGDQPGGFPSGGFP
jgi:hypothetical protein